MGSGGMNSQLKDFAKDSFPNSKTDLFSIYIERCLDLTLTTGEVGMVTPFVWMFIGTYERLRNRVLNEHTLTSLIQLEYNAFAPACIPVCAFTIKNNNISNFTGSYIRLSEFKGHENQPIKTLEAIKSQSCGWFHKSKPINFNKIPSSPIVYWFSDRMLEVYSKGDFVKDKSNSSEGVKTGENERFLRTWQEISLSKFAVPSSCELGEKKWFPHHKGGFYRRWYGNLEFVINWELDGKEIKDSKNSGLQGKMHYFNEGITWSKLSSTYFGVRYLPKGVLFDSGSPACFPENIDVLNKYLGFFQSKVASYLISATNPTLNIQVGNVANLPFISDVLDVDDISDYLTKVHKKDWDSYERSWSFARDNLIEQTQLNKEENKLINIYEQLVLKNEALVDKCQSKESLNNQNHINAYGLTNVISPDVPKEQVTLTCNPVFRYGKKIQMSY